MCESLRLKSPLASSLCVSVQLEAYCEASPTARVLYVHSKGASVPLRHMPSFLPVSEWRRYMEHFTIMRFHDCLEAMQEQQGEEQAYNTCGVELIHENGLPYFYAGNFCESTTGLGAQLCM